jgi:hypothetical protein
VYATRPSALPAGFFPAVDPATGETTYSIARSGATLSLEPGYYSLTVPAVSGASYAVEVRNLKSDELILKLNQVTQRSTFPFSVFPARMNSSFRLFATAPEVISPNQQVQFHWTSKRGGLSLEKIEPAVRVSSTDFNPNPLGSNRPYLLFKQDGSFSIRTTLRNRGNSNVAVYIESYLSQIGEAQPWKNFDAASSAQEFFLEPAQRISIDVPMNTRRLTGDYQLSYWIFTRRDLPFSPQNGGWFNKQIRVEDAKLGLHPIYGVHIP